MFHIGSDTDFGMNWNSSDCLGMNSYPIISPGCISVFEIIINRALKFFSKFIRAELLVKSTETSSCKNKYRSFCKFYEFFYCVCSLYDVLMFFKVNSCVCGGNFLAINYFRLLHPLITLT